MGSGSCVKDTRVLICLAARNRSTCSRSLVESRRWRRGRVGIEGADRVQEVCVTSKYQHSKHLIGWRYVSKDPKTMDGVFDDQGYFKTGDLARRKGPNYVILGRASQDGMFKERLPKL